MNGPEILIPILGIIGFFSSVICFFFFFFRSRHAERMALIESGRSADIFKQHRNEGSKTFRIGLLFVGAGGGLFCGLFMEQMFGLWDASAAIPLAFFGGGLGLVFYYLKINRNYDQEEY